MSLIIYYFVFLFSYCALGMESFYIRYSMFDLFTVGYK